MDFLFHQAQEHYTDFITVSNASIFKKMSNLLLPAQPASVINQAVNWPADLDNLLFVSSSVHGEPSRIWKLDLVQNSCSCICSHADEIISPYTFMDDLNRILFIMDGNIVVRLSLDSLTLHTECVPPHRTDTFDSYAMSVATPDGCVHCLSTEYGEIIHRIYDKKKQKHDEKCVISIDDGFFVRYPNLVFDPFSCSLMICGSADSDQIWTCFIGESDQKAYDWKLEKEIQMPDWPTKNTWSVRSIACFDMIWFFYMDKDDGSIQIFDCRNKKFYKFGSRIPRMIRDGSKVFKRNGYDVSFIKFGTSEHFIANLYDMIPMQLMKERREMYYTLICYYVEKYEKIFGNYIHENLKNLICRFYPFLGQ